MPASLTKQLSDSLQRITDLFSQFTDEQWHRDQNGKWTLAQELAHLLTSTQQTGLLLSSMGRSRWQPVARPSRSYEEIRDQYLDAIASRGGVFNPATAPSEEANQLSAPEQLANWQQAANLLKSSVGALSDEDLDNFTVWKHPLLEPVTGREMVYFTTYHTLHHEASLRRKMGEIAI